MSTTRKARLTFTKQVQEGVQGVQGVQGGRGGSRCGEGRLNLPTLSNTPCKGRRICRCYTGEFILHEYVYIKNSDCMSVDAGDSRCHGRSFSMEKNNG